MVAKELWRAGWERHRPKRKNPPGLVPRPPPLLWLDFLGGGAIQC